MDRAPYTAARIANYFIAKSHGRLTPLQLIKLVYYAHGYHLAIFNSPLIDEVVEAWQYGPVIPSLYQELKRWGTEPVRDMIPEFDFHTASLVDAPPPEPTTDPERVKLLDRIYQVFGSYSGGQLSEMTHAPGSPWYAVYQREVDKKGFAPRNLQLPNGLLMRHFRSVLERKPVTPSGK